MLLLALDTATPAVTVALHDGVSVVALSTDVDARRHGELLLPAVDRVLAAAGVKLADVTDIAVGVGPGPYTGLRVGLMTADTFAFTLGVPLHGVCTLDSLAYAYGTSGAAPPGPFVVATDARRKEVYWARYEDVRTRGTPPAVDRPAAIVDQVAGLPAVGEGAFLYPEVFPDQREPRYVPAGAVAALAAERLAAGERVPAREPAAERGTTGSAPGERPADEPGGPGASEPAVVEPGVVEHAAAGGAGAVRLLPPRPLYLRRPDAQVPKNYKVVTPR